MRGPRAGRQGRGTKREEKRSAGAGAGGGGGGRNPQRKAGEGKRSRAAVLAHRDRGGRGIGTGALCRCSRVRVGSRGPSDEPPPEVEGDHLADGPAEGDSHRGGGRWPFNRSLKARRERREYKRKRKTAARPRRGKKKKPRSHLTSPSWPSRRTPSSAPTPHPRRPHPCRRGLPKRTPRDELRAAAPREPPDWWPRRPEWTRPWRRAPAPPRGPRQQRPRRRRHRRRREARQGDARGPGRAPYEGPRGARAAFRRGAAATPGRGPAGRAG